MAQTQRRATSEPALADPPQRTHAGHRPGCQAHTSSGGGYTTCDTRSLATNDCSGAQYGFATSAARVACHDGCTPWKSSGTVAVGRWTCGASYAGQARRPSAGDWRAAAQAAQRWPLALLAHTGGSGRGCYSLFLDTWRSSARHVQRQPVQLMPWVGLHGSTYQLQCQCQSWTRRGALRLQKLRLYLRDGHRFKQGRHSRRV